MQIKALVADDSGVMRKMIIRALNETDYKPSQIIEAVDGVDALKKFEENSEINLILSDWNMPNMDGLTFVKKVREKNKDIAIIMITTEGTMGKMDEALGSGAADNYVVKPFTADALQQKLLKTMGKIK